MHSTNIRTKRRMIVDPHSVYKAGLGRSSDPNRTSLIAHQLPTVWSLTMGHERCSKSTRQGAARNIKLVAPVLCCAVRALPRPAAPAWSPGARIRAYAAAPTQAKPRSLVVPRNAVMCSVAVARGRQRRSQRLIKYYLIEQFKTHVNCYVGTDTRLHLDIFICLEKLILNITFSLEGNPSDCI